MRNTRKLLGTSRASTSKGAPADVRAHTHAEQQCGRCRCRSHQLEGWALLRLGIYGGAAGGSCSTWELFQGQPCWSQSSQQRRHGWHRAAPAGFTAVFKVHCALQITVADEQITAADKQQITAADEQQIVQSNALLPSGAGSRVLRPKAGARPRRGSGSGAVPEGRGSAAAAQCPKAAARRGSSGGKVHSHSLQQRSASARRSCHPIQLIQAPNSASSVPHSAASELLWGAPATAR